MGKETSPVMGSFAVQCQGRPLTMNQHEPAVYTAIRQTFCRSKSENVWFELDMQCFMVLLYTILRNLACMKPKNWWDYPYSLLRIFDVIIVSWVSVNSDDSRCIVSFWKMWVFHCSASLPQGEYVSQIDGWWFSIAKSTPSQAINDLLCRQKWTKQYYLGTTMKHRDHVEKWCTNHYWKVVHYSTCYPIQSDRTREACSCQVVSKHFSVYGPQILAQCEEARCDWRWCRCWGEMGWTYIYI